MEHEARNSAVGWHWNTHTHIIAVIPYLYPGKYNGLQFNHIINHVTDRNTSHLMNIFSVNIFVKERPRD